MKKRLFSLVLATLCFCHAEEQVVITNPLNLDWPWELVHYDLPAAAVKAPVTVQIGDEQRPGQVEAVPNSQQARVWFIATIKAQPKSDKDSEGVRVLFKSGGQPSPMTMDAQPDAIVIGNGVYQIKVPKFSGDFKTPKALKDLPAIISGVKMKDDTEFYGKTWYEGDLQVSNAKTEILANGPVFTTVRITLEFAGNAQAAKTEGNSDNAAAKEFEGAKRGLYYEATLRFVMGDPWVDVTESYNLPNDASYWLELKEKLNPDTVMWIRWFGYDGFGGNTEMHFAPLQPQQKQRGPFVALRPRWSQMPGGGQDFFVTRGGETPKADKKTGEFSKNDKYNPAAPAVGIVATYPMKWFNPYAQTINAFAENGDTARLKFPLRSGMRSYAIVVGPREKFDSTGKLNFLVRRHTDWTLDKQFNNYVLEWNRDPAKAGPHIIMTAPELKHLQEDFKGSKDTPEMRIVKEFIEKKDKLRGSDKDLLALITGENVKAPQPPSAMLWINTRYQDDFLNPTGTTRRLKEGFPMADLLSNGKPFGGPWQAALGYIFTDLNQWPGYENGWGPGNPNFHTDKYSIAIYAGAAMLDHPAAKQWLDFGKKNFDDDVAKVLLPPDGVGYECPGYSTYSLTMQLDLARVFLNTGYGNPIVENPLFKKSGVFHRNLLTPLDKRINKRHQAPIGDTHRWGANDGEMFGALAKFFKKTDPPFASEMMGIWKLYRDQGMRGTLISDLVNVDQSIPPALLEKMDWGSYAFYGFGSIMRSRFNTPRETFVTFKAGPAKGHYHNDELSYHFYAEGTPISLDYNCSYHPRGDHAALHNSMTFGKSAPFKHVGDDKEVPAQEQIGGVATLVAFNSTPNADVAVADLSDDTLSLTPIYPEDTKFQYPYPSRKVDRITHRRFLILVKHKEGSKLNDYIVVRDETLSTEPQQLNIHLLARDVKRDGAIIRATGQWDCDAIVYLGDSKADKFDVGRWYYYDEFMTGPGKYKKGKEDEEASKAWIQKIHDTDGEALIPPVGWDKEWQVGEYQKWLKIGSPAGTPMMWVLYAKKQGQPEPKFETADDGRTIKVSVENESDEIRASTVWPAAAKMQGIVTVNQNGETTVLLKEIVPVGEAIQGPLGLAGKDINDAAPRK